MLKQWNVGILLFNEVEVLDFTGPFEVFSITTYPGCNEKPFNVKTVAQNKNLIKARNGLQIQPDYEFTDAPYFDILIIPGGYGAEEIEIHNPKVINWIKERMINMSFHIIKKLLGEEIANTTAKRMEYGINI